MMLEYRVGILGSNSEPQVPWTLDTLLQLKDMGFNTMQLNIAWGPRPADEPLNMEDVVSLPPDQAASLPQPLALRSNQSPTRVAERKTQLKERIALCQQAGMRSIFHFGAPYNSFYGYQGKALPNCLLDGVTTPRQIALMEAFAKEYPGVDDLLIYTFDQDAWLCDEFGPCERCRGIPLHQRAADFINTLAQAWRRVSPQGRIWWEPWELSAGQVYKSIELLDPCTTGLSIHSNIAEVMAALPADRWYKNTAHLAAERGIPVIGEHWLGAGSEELEFYFHLQHPLVTWRALQAMTAIHGIVGIKEYYGLMPHREDPNLRATSLFIQHPEYTEEQALASLAEPYGGLADEMVRYWRLSSSAMEFIPWDISWFMRDMQRSNVSHAMTAAFTRGQQCRTPSWESTRRAIFMKTDSAQPDPYLLEDIQLRCAMAAQYLFQALQAGKSFVARVRADWRPVLYAALAEQDGMRRRLLAYAYHLRETNLATIMRVHRAEGAQVPAMIAAELRETLKADQYNQAQDEPIDEALALLDSDLDTFLATYYQIGPDTLSRGHFSLTSR
ncbi:MAG: hypothetical protein LLG44_03235 [Chloroflexi bacterium]|nr:hypothetical protein [Chloroflexota bacterium]